MTELFYTIHTPIRDYKLSPLIGKDVCCIAVGLSYSFINTAEERDAVFTKNINESRALGEAGPK